MGRLIDATTFADLEARRFTLRVSATRRDTKASRKDTKMQQGSELPGLGKGASSVKSERESLDGHARIRAEITLVEDRQFLLGLKRNVPQGKFLLKALRRRRSVRRRCRPRPSPRGAGY